MITKLYSKFRYQCSELRHYYNIMISIHNIPFNTFIKGHIKVSKFLIYSNDRYRCHLDNYIVM